MAAKINRTGKTYGDLTVLETILGSNSKTDTYLVKCNCCGNTMIIGIDALLKGLKCKNCRNKDRKSTYQDLIGKECNGIKVVSLAEDAIGRTGHRDISKMNTCTLKFEATAFRENDDNELESLSASISVPVENDDEVIGNTLGEEKLIVHAVAALYNLISDLRPNWLDNEDTSLTLDISIDGRKAQSCSGLVAMKEEGFTFGLED